MASKSPQKSGSKVQKCNVSGSVSPSEKNLTSSTAAKGHAGSPTPENGKTCKSPKQGCALSPPRVMSPSGKKRLSPISNPLNFGSMNSLNVEVNRSKMNSVSPGRQCLSDSRLTVKPSKSIPVSSYHKRKIDLDGANLMGDVTIPMTSPKRKKPNAHGICNSHEVNDMHRQQKDHITVDWNQNEKNLVDGPLGKRRASWSETSPTNYKHSHSIGHRKLSPKLSNNSELAVTNSWKASSNTSPKAQSNHKEMNSMDRHVNNVSPTSGKMQNGRIKSTATSNGEQKRPSYSHSISNDSVFEDNGTEQNEMDDEKFEKVDSEVAFNKISAAKSSPSGDVVKGKHLTGRTSPRGCVKPKEVVVRKHTTSSVDSGIESKRKRKESYSESVGSESVVSSCTEDSFTDDGSIAGRESLSSPEEGKVRKRKFKYADTLPPRAPRVRRVASLTAETKVHILYERDDFIEKWPVKVAGPKKPKSSENVRATVNNGIVAVKPPVISAPPPVSIKEDNPMPPAPKVQKVIKEQKKLTNGQMKVNDTLKEPSTELEPKEVSSTVPIIVVSQPKVVSQEMCNRCGKPLKPAPCNRSAGTHKTTPNSNSAKPESQNSKNNNNISISTIQSMVKEETKTSPMSTTSQNQSLCECPQTVRSISEPASGGSLMKALAPLLGQPRRASVDAAECEKLNASLKGPFLLRLSRHSIEAPTAIASQLSLPLAQLGLLQTGALNTPIGTPSNGTLTTVTPRNGTGSTVTEFVTSKSKVVRKVVKLPGLKPFHRRKSTNGWRGEGEPILKPVIINNEAVQEMRYCYSSIRRKDDVIKARDCVLLRAGLKKRDLPFVAKVAALYEDPETGDLMMSLLWYYRPEHTEAGRLSCHLQNELFACRHWDINSVACIEDKCYVVTQAEYNRFYSKLRRTVEGIRPGRYYVPEHQDSYHRKDFIPPHGFDPEAVFLCRQVYDFRQRRVLKNPY